MAWKYLLSDVGMGEAEARAVADVVRGKWLSAGPRTAEFEQRFAQFVGADHAVATSSCTSALHLALMGLGVGPGDEVLVPSYTFVASANAILYQGAVPVFVDIIGPHDLNLNPDDLARKITNRAKAVMVVHLAGFPVDMDRVREMAGRHGLPVVEDACHAIGAEYEGRPGGFLNGRRAGTLGEVGCFSFFANKNLVTGEGGMLVTDDSELAERARRARSHGMTKSSWDKADGRAFDYDVVSLGHNYRPTELTSALGLIQLGKLADANRRRGELVEVYRRRLAGAPGLVAPFASRRDSAHHIFPVVLASPDWRPLLRERMASQGIQTSVHYPPVHLFSHYRRSNARAEGLERTEDVAARELTLPLHPLLSEDDVHAICDTLLVNLRELPGYESMLARGAG